MRELTIQEACSAPANFMYVWADEDRFLKYIKPKHAAVIRQKKANQNKFVIIALQCS